MGGILVTAVTPRPDTAALRKVAEAATPGPWWTHHSTPSEVWCGDEALTLHLDQEGGTDDEWEAWERVGTRSIGDFGEADAAHVAAFDPPTALALLDRLEAAERQVAAVEELADEWDAAGIVSVYESAAELAQILRAALGDGDTEAAGDV